jgi:site-specific recombinase XerD
LEALQKLSRWAVQTKRMKSDVAISLKPIKFVRNRQPLGLLENEFHALLRVAGSSNFVVRNYALMQLMAQTGLRVSEVADLKMGDIKISERAGTVSVRQGSGILLL